MKFDYHQPVIVLDSIAETLRFGIFLRDGTSAVDRDYAQVKVGDDIQWLGKWTLNRDTPELRQLLQAWLDKRKAAKKAYDDLMGELYELKNKQSRGEL